MVVTARGVQLASVGKARYAATYSTMHRIGSHNKELSGKKKKKNSTNAKIEGPCCKLLGLFINTE